MNTSQAAIDLIKTREDFAPKAYADGEISGVKQHSIGYGHQIQPGESNLLTMTISRDTAEALLRSDVAPLETQLNRDLRVKPSQNQFDALVDFGYNCGPGALAKVIGTWNAIKDGNLKPVTDEISAYNKTHVNGQLVVSSTLTKRRSQEVSLFNSSLPPGLASGAVTIGGVLVAGVVTYILLSKA
ncbi:MAG: lysozyme [Bacteroidota bacterium]